VIEISFEVCELLEILFVAEFLELLLVAKFASDDPNSSSEAPTDFIESEICFFVDSGAEFNFSTEAFIEFNEFVNKSFKHSASLLKNISISSSLSISASMQISFAELFRFEFRADDSARSRLRTLTFETKKNYKRRKTLKGEKGGKIIGKRMKENGTGSERTIERVMGNDGIDYSSKLKNEEFDARASDGDGDT